MPIQETKFMLEFHHHRFKKHPPQSLLWWWGLCGQMLLKVIPAVA